MLFSRVTGNQIISIICLIYIIGLVFGSRLYVLAPAFSIMNMLLYPLLLIVIYQLAKYKFNKKFLYSFLLIFCYTLLVTIYTIYFFGLEQLKDLVYTLHIIVVLFVSVFLTRNTKAEKKLFNFLYFLYLILFVSALLQGLSLFGLFPVFWKNEIGSGLELGLITGPYANPNNLATVALLFFCLLYWKFDQSKNIFKKRMLKIITLLIILATLSRLVFVLFFMYYFIFKLYKKQYKNLFVSSIVVIILVGMAITFIANVNQLSYAEYGKNVFTVNINRIIAIGDLFNSNQNQSSDIRLSSYSYFFHNIDRAFVGHGSQTYHEFYKDARFDTSLIANYPHSYWVESSLAYGLLAPVIVIIFISTLTIHGFLSGANGSYILIMTIYFGLLINIPSSVFRLTVVWLPFLLVYASIVRNKNDLSAC